MHIKKNNAPQKGHNGEENGRKKRSELKSRKGYNPSKRQRKKGEENGGKKRSESKAAKTTRKRQQKSGNESGGKKRSRSNVIKTVRIGNFYPPPPPPAQGKSGSNVATGERHTPPPAEGRISRTSSATSIGTFESPPFDCANVRQEDSFENTDKEYKCSLCLEIFLGCYFDAKNPSVSFDTCDHRFCRECILASKEKLPNCLVAGCDGKTCDDVFRQDDELIRRIIKESCSVSDREVESKNKGIAANVAGSRSTKKSCKKKSLTSG